MGSDRPRGFRGGHRPARPIRAKGSGGGQGWFWLIVIVGVAAAFVFGVLR